MLRRLPALCAGVLMLAACADGGALKAPEPSGLGSTGIVTPGSVEDDPCGHANIGNTIHFVTDSAVLSEEAQQTAQRQACWIRAYPQHGITIEGHADERGTPEYNLALGEKRAQAVKNYLVALGVEGSRLKTISFGKERPVCTTADDACWTQNRRAVSTVDQ